MKSFQVQLTPTLFGFMRGSEGLLHARDDAKRGLMRYSGVTFWHSPQIIYSWPDDEVMEQRS